MVFAGLTDIGVALLLGVALAEFAKVRHKSDMGFNWLAVSGVLFLFSGTFSSAAALTSYFQAGISLMDVFSIIGWIVALIGTVVVAKDLLMEK